MKIIAEVGSTHDGSLGNALKSIEMAASAGATHCKFQTHIAEFETLRNAPNPHYFSAEDRYKYFERTAFDEDSYYRLVDKCESLNITFMSSPFCLEAVDLLERIGCRSFKIPSGEVTCTPLIERLALVDGEIFLSSGMSSWDELDRAVRILDDSGANYTVMQCSSEYPCSPENVGWNVFSEMQQRYGMPVGFSDHTSGVAASVLAVAAGVRTIEKHFTLSNLLYGSDAANSLDPCAFKRFCIELRDACSILDNKVDKDAVGKYRDMKVVFEKSVVSKKKLDPGHVITEADLAFKKPGLGISASNYQDLLGRILTISVSPDHLFAWRDFE